MIGIYVSVFRHRDRFIMHHGDIWRGIDLLAAKHGLSPSGLAKRAGLDATAFNKSKRVSVDGRLRWPSTESLSRALTAVGEAFRDFAGLIEGEQGVALPLLDFSEARRGQHFDDSGRPQGDLWETIQMPGESPDEGLFILEVADASLTPGYRGGDRLVISPGAQIRSGDRVVIRTQTGEIQAYELGRRTKTRVIVKSLGGDRASHTLTPADIAWIARILWVSQ